MLIVLIVYVLLKKGPYFENMGLSNHRNSSQEIVTGKIGAYSCLHDK
jgi:hypothetical protein